MASSRITSSVSLSVLESEDTKDGEGELLKSTSVAVVAKSSTDPVKWCAKRLGNKMSGISIWQIIIIFLMFSVVILPCVMALFSKKIHGGKKFAWFLLSFMLSWVGYSIFYLTVVRPAQKQTFIPMQDNPGRQHPY